MNRNYQQNEEALYRLICTFTLFKMDESRFRICPAIDGQTRKQQPMILSLALAVLDY